MPKSGATTHIRGTEPGLIEFDSCKKVGSKKRSAHKNDIAIRLPNAPTPPPPSPPLVVRTLEERRGPLLLEDGAEAVAHVPVLLLPARQLQPRLHHVGGRGGPGTQRARDAAGAQQGADAGIGLWIGLW